MRNKDVLDILNEIEEKFPVSTWEIEDLHVWPIMRINLMFQLLQYQNKQAKKEANSMNWVGKCIFIIKRLINYTVNYWSDKDHNAKIGKISDVVFLGHSVNRVYKVNKTEDYDSNLGPIIDFFNKIKVETFKFEILDNKKKINRHDPSYYINLQTLWVRVKGKFIKGQNVRLEKFDEFARYISQFGIVSSKRNLCISAKRVILLTRFFEKKIAISKANLGITVCYYSMEGFSFVFACKRLKIPVVDIQHGVAGNTLHPAYSKWSHIPKGGYEILPDIFWCWDKKDANAINEWNFECTPHHKAIVGGNPKNEMWKEDSDLALYYDQVVKNNAKVSTDKNILLTLQSYAIYPQWLFNAVENSSNDWRWYIRTHPCLDKRQENYVEIFKTYKNVEIKLACEIPLGALLRNMDVHVTMHSSTVLEAREFGVLSVVIDNEIVEDFFHGEINDKTVLIAKSRKSLINNIAVQIESKRERVGVSADKEKAFSFLNDFIKKQPIA